MGEIEDIIARVNPKYSKGSIWENQITYDTSTSTLEPLYFWIIDFLGSYKPEKLVDSFTASPGSTYFGELGKKATLMQEEGIKILGSVNIVIKSIINLIYDLRNFELRLKEYDRVHSDDPDEVARGILALKEVWMNSTDSLRGMGSINNMAQQYGFTLLRPAFMSVMPPKGGKLKDAIKMVDKMDLNKTVTNVLKPRVAEFYDWVELSEAELRKRYQIQRSYLKNQVSTLKLYSSWVKPYIRAAEQLRMKESREPSLVSVFGSMILELTLLGKKKVNVVDEAKSGGLPPAFEDKAEDMRSFWKVILVDFKFRTYPTQAAPHAGRVDITFKAYAMNDDELLLFEKLREDDMIESVLGISDQVTGETLNQLKTDIEHFFEEPKKEKKKESDFMFFGGEDGLFKDLKDEVKKYFVKKTWTEKEKEAKEEKDKKKKEKEEKVNKIMEEGIQEDNYEEGVVREFTEINAAEFAFKAFDIFKKSQGMASFPSPFDDPSIVKRFRDKRAEIDALLKDSK